MTAETERLQRALHLLRCCHTGHARWPWSRLRYEPDRCEICAFLVEPLTEPASEVAARWRAAKMRAALTSLEAWDMLGLTSDGRGAITADAPWARALIADALRESGGGSE